MPVSVPHWLCKPGSSWYCVVSLSLTFLQASFGTLSKANLSQAMVASGMGVKESKNTKKDAAAEYCWAHLVKVWPCVRRDSSCLKLLSITDGLPHANSNILKRVRAWLTC